jgi:hypothetical protein
VPGRLALAAAGVILGVIVGTSIRESDVRESLARGESIRGGILAWRTARGGAWPATLSEAVPDAPTTRMGAFDPPAFVWDPATHRLSFSLGSGAEVRSDLAVEPSKWERVRR